MEGIRTQHNQAVPRTNQNQVRCIQINMQHSRTATDNLMKKIYDEEPDIILIQEPYECQSRLTGIDKKYRIFSAGTGKHRAAIIIINNNIDAILITKISDEDTVVVEITHDKWKFLAASMYFDLEEQIENKFIKMDELVRVCQRWKDINSRGQ